MEERFQYIDESVNKIKKMICLNEDKLKIDDFDNFEIIFMKYNKKIYTDPKYLIVDLHYLKINKIYWYYFSDEETYSIFKIKNKYCFYSSCHSYYKQQDIIYRYKNGSLEYNYDNNEKLRYFDTYYELIESLNYEIYQLYLKTTRKLSDLKAYKFKKIHEELALVPCIGIKYQELKENWNNYLK
jgi:hypothetical protein